MTTLLNTLTIKIEFTYDSVRSVMNGVYAYANAIGNNFRVQYISKRTPEGYECSDEEIPDGAEAVVMDFMKFMEDTAKSGGFISKWMRIRDKMAYIPTSEEDVDDEIISTSVVCVVRDGYCVNVQGFICMTPRWDYKLDLERK